MVLGRTSPGGSGGRVLSSIATDNGRAATFIKKKVYMDKSRCYECGEEGHLSRECPRNQLGPKDRSVPKKLRRRLDSEDETEAEVGLDFDDDNWALVVDGGAQERLIMGETKTQDKRKKLKKLSYFSDESDEGG